MLFGLLFSFFSFCLCTIFIDTSLGIEQFNYFTNDGDIININVTVYPSFLVFIHFGDDTLYRDCHYPIDGPPDCHEQVMRFIPIYSSISNPTHLLEIETPVSTNLSFMTVTLPGMCSNGIYFSILQFGTLRLHRGGDGFHNLSVFDDKCLVFGPQEKVSLVLTMKSQDFEDQLFVYWTFTNFTSVSGNGTLKLNNYDGSKEPLFVRFVADDFEAPHEVNIEYLSSANFSRNPRFDYALPPILFQVCDEESTGSMEGLAISFIILIVGFGGILLIWICFLSVRQTAVPVNELL
jgi:hypothetical protein